MPDDELDRSTAVAARRTSTAEMRRWLDTGNNSETLMAHLHDEPVDLTWLRTYRRLGRDLMSAVGNAQEQLPRRR